VDSAARLGACKRRWDLQGGSRLGGGFRSDVFACSAAGGDQVVVKLTATPEEARLEAAALTLWAHTGAAVRLIDADITHGALLLERIWPGTPLPGGGDPVSAGIAARLLARVHLAAHGQLPFPALEDIYLRLESRARDDAAFEQRTRGDPARGAAGLQRLELARAAAMDLCATTGRPVLLHGDFVDKNLLRSGAGLRGHRPDAPHRRPMRGRRLVRRLPSARDHDPAASRSRRRADEPEPAASASLGSGMGRPADLSGLAGRPVRP